MLARFFHRLELTEPGHAARNSLPPFDQGVNCARTPTARTTSADRATPIPANSGLVRLDRIVDFNVPNDTIRLDNAIFTGLPAGRLKADAFFIGAAAHDASDRIIYNKVNGELFFDSNGSAAGGSTHFATLKPALALTNADFVVF